MKKHSVEVNWSGDGDRDALNASVNALIDTIVVTGCKPSTAGTLFRALILLRREQPLEIKMDEELWSIAQMTGFESALR